MKTKLPFARVERNFELLQIIHCDICELNRNLTSVGNRYFGTFIHDYSKHTHVYFMKHKDEFSDKFKLFQFFIKIKKKKD